MDWISLELTEVMALKIRRYVELHQSSCPRLTQLLLPAPASKSSKLPQLLSLLSRLSSGRGSDRETGARIVLGIDRRTGPRAVLESVPGTVRESVATVKIAANGAGKSATFSTLLLRCCFLLSIGGYVSFFVRPFLSRACLDTCLLSSLDGGCRPLYPFLHSIRNFRVRQAGR